LLAIPSQHHGYRTTIKSTNISQIPKFSTGFSGVSTGFKALQLTFR
jgi:hypothetical protein